MVPYKLCLKWDSNLGPKGLSLLEFETWRLRPPVHYGRYLPQIFVSKSLKEKNCPKIIGSNKFEFSVKIQIPNTQKHLKTGIFGVTNLNGKLR